MINSGLTIDNRASGKDWKRLYSPQTILLIDVKFHTPLSHNFMDFILSAHNLFIIYEGCILVGWELSNSFDILLFKSTDVRNGLGMKQYESMPLLLCIAFECIAICN